MSVYFTALFDYAPYNIIRPRYFIRTTEISL